MSKKRLISQSIKSYFNASQNERLSLMEEITRCCIGIIIVTIVVTILIEVIKFLIHIFFSILLMYNEYVSNTLNS